MRCEITNVSYLKLLGFEARCHVAADVNTPGDNDTPGLLRRKASETGRTAPKCLGAEAEDRFLNNY